MIVYLQVSAICAIPPSKAQQLKLELKILNLEIMQGYYFIRAYNDSVAEGDNVMGIVSYL